MDKHIKHIDDIALDIHSMYARLSEYKQELNRFLNLGQLDTDNDTYIEQLLDAMVEISGNYDRLADDIDALEDEVTVLREAIDYDRVSNVTQSR